MITQGKLKLFATTAKCSAIRNIGANIRAEPGDDWNVHVNCILGELFMTCVADKKHLGLQTLLISGVVVLSTLAATAAEKPATSSVVKTANSTKEVAPTPETAPPPVAIPWKDLADTATAAEVNGVRISMKDINSAIDAIKKREPSLADGSPAAIAELTKFRQSMLNDLIDFELLLQEAKKRNINPDPKKVDAELWQIKGKFPNPDSFNQWLQASGQTEAELRQSTVDNMTVEELGNQLSVDVTVSDADLQKFYDDNKDRFILPESVMVSHILIAVPQDATDADKQKLKDQADKVLKEASKPNADFSALAAKYSDDKSTADKGGSLGALVQVDKGSWKPLVDAAFAATPGKVISKLVETDFGYHIVDPIEKKPGRQLTLDEVRADIKPMVLHQKVEAVIDAEIHKLRQAATIKTYI
jgi:peptidyl-prolyl cis-trans isomerase C